MQRNLLVLIVLVMLALIIIGCTGTLSNNVATLNTAATNVASGSIDITPPEVDLPIGNDTPEPTEAPTATIRDLTLDPGASLVNAWGQTYAQESGSMFVIIATQRQVSDFVLDTLQLGGWQDTVQGGSVHIGQGQIRVDLALVVGDEFGQGTATFQPTLDALGRVRLNPQGGEFGQLDIPANLIPAIGDAVHTALTGARSEQLSQVTLSSFSLENDLLQVEGTVR